MCVKTCAPFKSCGVAHVIGAVLIGDLHPAAHIDGICPDHQGRPDPRHGRSRPEPRYRQHDHRGGHLRPARPRGRAPWPVGHPGLFPVSDYLQLAKLMNEIMNSEKYSANANFSQDRLKYFSPEENCRKIKEIYLACLNK